MGVYYLPCLGCELWVSIRCCLRSSLRWKSLRYSEAVDIYTGIIIAMEMAARHLPIFFPLTDIVKLTPVDQCLLIALLYTNEECSEKQRCVMRNRAVDDSEERCRFLLFLTNVFGEQGLSAGKSGDAAVVVISSLFPLEVLCSKITAPLGAFFYEWLIIPAIQEWNWSEISF